MAFISLDLASVHEDENTTNETVRWDGSLLDCLEGTFKKHVILPEFADTALALWTLYTYCYDAFFISPRLLVSSPEKRCGKTTLLSVLSYLVCKPQLASNVTPASLYRSIAQGAGTFIIDEADTFLKGNSVLNGIINSGHSKRFSNVRRVDSLASGGYEPKDFSTWAPMVIAMISKPKDTLIDRSIIIGMRRKKEVEVVAKLHTHKGDPFIDLKQCCEVWAKEKMDLLKKAILTYPRN
jgi:hypothetical protein